MYYTSPSSTITPAMVSVAMSRSDSRDSNYSTASSTMSHFTAAPLAVSYSSSPVSYLARTSSNTSSSSMVSIRRASNASSRRDSTSQWIPSPYRSCHRGSEDATSYLSDDDLLYIAPPSVAAAIELPVNHIPSTEILRKKDLTTEEQIALLREAQAKQDGDVATLQQQRRQAAAAAQRAVRFAPEQAKPRRPSNIRRRATTVRKGMSHLNGPQ